MNAFCSADEKSIRVVLQLLNISDVLNIFELTFYRDLNMRGGKVKLEEMPLFTHSDKMSVLKFNERIDRVREMKLTQLSLILILFSI